MRRHQGFTLVELIVVITLLGIISLVTVGFITSTVQGYADLTRRDQLSSAARVAVERMARELRNALPNSIRVADDCIEFIPALAASRYLTLPLTSASNAFSSVPFATQPELGRVAVYPIDTNTADEPLRPAGQNPIYDIDQGDSATIAIISPPINTSTVLNAASGAVDVVLTSNHRFPAEAPSKRYFIVDEPVSFCVVGSDLYRFQGTSGSAYTYALNQPTGGTLFTNLAEPQKALLASDVVSPVDNNVFTYSGATLLRNGIVLFDLFVEDQQLTSADRTRENIRVQFEVQIKNAP